MADPKTVAEYNKLIRANSATEGDPADPLLRIPCPFCTAPNFFVAHQSQADAVFTTDHTCMTCKRTARMVLRHRAQGPPEAELFQTGGADPARYLPIRRLL